MTRHVESRLSAIKVLQADPAWSDLSFDEMRARMYAMTRNNIVIVAPSRFTGDPRPPRHSSVRTSRAGEISSGVDAVDAISPFAQEHARSLAGRLCLSRGGRQGAPPTASPACAAAR